MVLNVMIKKTWFFTIILIMTACTEYDVTDNACDYSISGSVQVEDAIVIDEIAYNSRVSDEFSIKEAFIVDDSLNLEIEYGGGCGTVEFRLVTDGLFMESNPVQLNISLLLDDNDTCKALLRKHIRISLSELADHYHLAYQNFHGTIIIHLEGFEETILYSF